MQLKCRRICSIAHKPAKSHLSDSDVETAMVPSTPDFTAMQHRNNGRIESKIWREAFRIGKRFYRSEAIIRCSSYLIHSQSVIEILKSSFGFQWTIIQSYKLLTRHPWFFLQWITLAKPSVVPNAVHHKWPRNSDSATIDISVRLIMIPKPSCPNRYERCVFESALS